MAELKYQSRRSAIFGREGKGMVATSQPHASAVGVKILQEGGNAMDAAVAVSAALQVTEPCSTGLGGDAYLLYYDAKEQKVHGVNGAGRSPAALSLDKLPEEVKGEQHLPISSIHAVTVPGSPATWLDTLEKWGTMDRAKVLEPAIDLAENGYTMGTVTSLQWHKELKKLVSWEGTNELLPDGVTAPKAGEVVKNPNVAKVLRSMVEKGKEGFYKGWVAEAIVETVKRHGGFMELSDLEAHYTEYVEPITADYRGYTVHEIPPNGQGIVALEALRILEGFEFGKMAHNSPEHIHLVIQALRLGFADAFRYVHDMNPDLKVAWGERPGEEGLCARQDIVKALLSDSHTSSRRSEIDPSKFTKVSHGVPGKMSNTVLFAIADKWGNAVSVVNSNYEGFGSGLAAKGCGFTLQNRGMGFNLDPTHPNALEGGKRAFNTIIPAIVTRKSEGGSNELYTAFGVMGGFMQPQGHVQALMNMIDWGMDPQQALEAPRFRLEVEEGEAGDASVSLEDSIPEEVAQKLREMGHTINPPVSGFFRNKFGKGQVVLKVGDGIRYIGGSEPRCDGCAMQEF